MLYFSSLGSTLPGAQALSLRRSPPGHSYPDLWLQPSQILIAVSLNSTSRASLDLLSPPHHCINALVIVKISTYAHTYPNTSIGTAFRAHHRLFRHSFVTAKPDHSVAVPLTISPPQVPLPYLTMNKCIFSSYALILCSQRERTKR